MGRTSISIAASDQRFDILAWYSYLLERLTSTARSTLIVLCLLLTGCGGGGGGTGGGGTGGGPPVASTPGSGGLPVVDPSLFVSGFEHMPSALLPFTSELNVVAITPDGRTLYAADTLHNTVSVFDLATNDVRAILDVGGNPRYIAITPDGTKVYVANGARRFDLGSNTVSVIDVNTDQVSTVDVGDSPFGIAITPDGSKAYVANRGDDTVSVIDVNTNAVILTLPVGQKPSVIAITPDGSKVYVTNKMSGDVYIISVEKDEILTAPTVGVGPEALTITPDGSKVYVANEFDNTVSVLDVNDVNKPAHAIDVGVGPSGIVVSPDGSRAYVANASPQLDNCNILGNTLSVIDVESDEVIPGAKEIEVGKAPLGMVITGDNSKLYVISACPSTNPISALATSSIPDDIASAVSTIAVDGQSRSTGIALKPDNSHVYVAHPSAISVINVSSDTVVATIPARGAGPTALAVDANGTKLYTANSGSDTVSVIDIASEQHLATLPVGSKPSAVAVTAEKAYVTNAGFSETPGNSISVIDVTANGADDSIETITVGAGPVDISITSDNKSALVPNFGDFHPADDSIASTASVIDLMLETVTSLDVGAGPSDIAINGSKAFVTNFKRVQDNNRDVSVIDLDLLSNPPLALDDPDFNQPINTAITSDGSRAVVVNYNGNPDGSTGDVQHHVTILALDPLANPNVIAKVIVDGPNPSAVAITPNDSKAYILNSGDRTFTCSTSTRCEIGNTVSVVEDLLTNAPSFKTNIPVGRRPAGIAVTDTRAYVTNFFDNTVSVINTVDDTIVTTLDVGVAPVGIVINGSKAYVANSVSKTVSVIDIATDTVLEPIPVNP